MKRHCYKRKIYKEKEEGKKVQGKPVGYSKNWLVIWRWLLMVLQVCFNKNCYLLRIFVVSLFQYSSGFGTELCKVSCPTQQAFKYVTPARKQSNKFVHVRKGFLAFVYELVHPFQALCQSCAFNKWMTSSGYQEGCRVLLNEMQSLESSGTAPA